MNRSDFLKEINNIFESQDHNMADKIFVMRSATCPENQNWDCIGFVLSDGKLKTMPDSIYNKINMDLPIKKSEHYHLIKKSRLSSIRDKMDVKYEEFKLKRPIVVMDKFHHHKPDSCGSYVLAVMNKNRNINARKLIEPASYSIDDIYKAIKLTNKDL